MRKILPRYYAYFFIASILAIILLSCTSCSSKPFPRKTKFPAAPSIDTTGNPCDSLIQAALSRVKPAAANDSTGNYNCEELQVEVIRLSQALSDEQKQNAILNRKLDEKPKEVETIVINKGRTKIKNSFNDNDKTKNSNNSTEITKLKNSILIQADTIGQLHTDKNILGSKVRDLEKEITKNKNSNTGTGTNAVKSGNTTSKAPPIAWIIVIVVCLVAGRLSRHISQLKWLP